MTYQVEIQPVPSVGLGPIDLAAVLAEDAERALLDKVLRYGVGREILVSQADGRWYEVRNVGWLWAVEVVSEGAVGIRLHFSGVDLPRGAEICVYAASDPQRMIAGPYGLRGVFGDGQFWTPTRFDERLRVECFVPTAAAEDLGLHAFLIDALQHVYRHPTAGAAQHSPRGDSQTGTVSQGNPPQGDPSSRAICPGAGDCCAVHYTPGCDDTICCLSVCLYDPFCCDVYWDQSCVDYAENEPNCDCGGGGGPCGPGAGDCCTGNGTPGCEDVSCCESVCSNDPICCNIGWDNTCAQAAAVDPNCDCSGTAPPNDDCEDAFYVFEGVYGFDTTGATTDGPDEPALCTFFSYTQIGSDIWYCYTAGCSGNATISLCGSAYDTKMAVYDTCVCPTSQSAVACNDDFCGAPPPPYLQSEITLLVVQGNSYLIRVGGYLGATGSGTLTITCGGAGPCGPDAGPCCWANGTPGCDDPECCESVCSNDPYCCDTEWDIFCAQDASTNGSCDCEACRIDVSCSPSWVDVAKACAGIGWIDEDSLFCSGQLLNTVANDQTPYWLTANHCLSTNAEAQNAEIYWLYQTSSCNGSPPDPSSAPQSAVCTLLSTGSSSDYTLLMVEGELPVGLYWSGWTDGPIPNGTPASGIHHPAGSWKRISHGVKSSSTSTDHWIGWSQGGTEGGSSGSGIFTDGTQHLLFGQLRGNVPDCWYEDNYGAFSVYYPSIADLLAAGSDDGLEDNNTCAEAHPLGAGSWSDLIVKYAPREDWYSFNVPGGGSIDVDLFFIDAFGDIDIELLDACGGSVVASSTSSTDNETISYTNPGASADFYLRVYLSSDTRNAYDMDIAVSPPSCVPPPNEACSGATTVTCAQIVAGYSTSGPLGCTEDCPGRGYFDVFYRYDCKLTASYAVGMCGSNGNTYLRVFSGSCCGTLVGSDDDSCGGLDPTLTLTLNAGTTYWFELGSYDSSGYENAPYNFDISVSLPDPCASITILPFGTPYGGTLATCGSWLDYTDCGLTENGEERAYQFTTTMAGDYALTGTVTSGDPDFFLMSACDPTSTNLIGACWGAGMRTVSLAASTTYYFIVDNHSGSSNAGYSIQVDEPSTGACCTLAPPDCHIDSEPNCDGTYMGDNSDCADDWDQNGQADICEEDCNGNGIVDACDVDCSIGNCNGHPLGCGGSDDCQPDGIPDQCEIPPIGTGPDCNANGVPDACDLDAGTSLNCNDNGVPDECEYPGCPGIAAADMTCDGSKDGDDVQRFVETIVAGDYTCQADMDQDGTVDATDVPLFVAALLSDLPRVVSSSPPDDSVHYKGCPADAVTIEFNVDVRGPGGTPLDASDFEVDGTSEVISNFNYLPLVRTATFTIDIVGGLAEDEWHTIRANGDIEDTWGYKLVGNTSGAEPGANHHWIDVCVLRGDFQQDRDVDVFDRTQFLVAWTAQNGSPGEGLSADFQCDADVDVFDRTGFLAAWHANRDKTMPTPPPH